MKKGILDCGRFYEIRYYGLEQDMEDRDLTVEEQAHIKRLLCNEYNGWSAANTLYKIYDRGAQKKFIEELIEELLDDKLTLRYENNYFLTEIIKLFALETDFMPKVKKWITHKNAPKSVHKYLLYYNKYTFDEEVLALRSFGQNNHSVKIKNYVVNPAALKKLPPVMRLNTINSLLNVSNYFKFNPMQNISEDELDLMLAPVMLKHTQKVSDIKNIFMEVAGDSNIRGLVNMHFNCATCGNVKIALESGIKSETSFKKTRAYKKNSNCCPICSSYSTKCSAITVSLA